MLKNYCMKGSCSYRFAGSEASAKTKCEATLAPCGTVKRLPPGGSWMRSILRENAKMQTNTPSVTAKPCHLPLRWWHKAFSRFVRFVPFVFNGRAMLAPTNNRSFSRRGEGFPPVSFDLCVPHSLFASLNFVYLPSPAGEGGPRSGG